MNIYILRVRNIRMIIKYIRINLQMLKNEYLTPINNPKRVEYFENSERSDECIVFTMIITGRNNAPISNYGDGFRCKSGYPWCNIECR
ncbi:Uncharacterized protein FWK35_00031356 [Aphis craccivora]|uniref:Uncharacterized protein n=1 Tax=Aphis craccivora TaxID=307492 RepID=A0A6G0Y2F1_APHCR|nr:Uncharacterized protein FWK35_00031356 [Aphis craccivora]